MGGKEEEVFYTLRGLTMMGRASLSGKDPTGIENENRRRKRERSEGMEVKNVVKRKEEERSLLISCEGKRI